MAWIMLVGRVNVLGYCYVIVTFFLASGNRFYIVVSANRVIRECVMRMLRPGAAPLLTAFLALEVSGRRSLLVKEYGILWRICLPALKVILTENMTATNYVHVCSKNKPRNRTAGDNWGRLFNLLTLNKWRRTKKYNVDFKVICHKYLTLCFLQIICIYKPCYSNGFQSINALQA